MPLLVGVLELHVVTLAADTDPALRFKPFDELSTVHIT
jgi:hypothetical protein